MSWDAPCCLRCRVASGCNVRPFNVSKVLRISRKIAFVSFPCPRVKDTSRPAAIAASLLAPVPPPTARTPPGFRPVVPPMPLL